MPPSQRYVFSEILVRAVVNRVVADGLSRLGRSVTPVTAESLAREVAAPETLSKYSAGDFEFTDEYVNTALVKSGVFSFPDYPGPRDSTDEWLDKLIGLSVTRPFGWKHPEKGTTPFRYPQTPEAQAVDLLGDCLAEEKRWRERNRPFYNVYPIIYDAVRSIRLDVDWKDVSLPIERSLLVRFANGYEPHGLSAVRYTEFRTNPSLSSNDAVRMATEELGINVGDRNIHVMPFFAGARLTLAKSFEAGFGMAVPTQGLSVEESLTRDDCLLGPVRMRQLPQYQDMRHFVLRLLGFISLVSNDPEVVAPYVLAADAAKYEELSDEGARQLITDRAIRLQGRGYEFGKKLQHQHDEAQEDTSRTVHYRKPHWALVWTGQGRKVPKITLRRGTWVNAAELFAVPTGYLGNETEDELLAVIAGTEKQCPGTVYFLQEADSPRVKIGRTETAVDERRKNLQTGNSRQLRLVGYIPTGKASRKEAELHRQLQNSRLSGEWFYLPLQQCHEIILQHGGVVIEYKATLSGAESTDE